MCTTTSVNNKKRKSSPDAVRTLSQDACEAELKNSKLYKQATYNKVSTSCFLYKTLVESDVVTDDQSSTVVLVLISKTCTQKKGKIILGIMAMNLLNMLYG